ncbi:sn-glycerol-3-phosphate ABC transporter ATP-binding protein UgpC [Vibrio navarrensis]|uniref:Sn-glycerol-3-phosphate ABC transporter ATP-binding protein UgpC n=1 Tax=Vibrio navarrensis TaxID=29495 RepID=A0A099LVP1_9VIBR|nr:sn-glycerol-3-phosphate ABC transporter ATP-binding protein UgpC [Vibrio navarrensis]EJK2113261.1 sn-glycerol-3-phosphate ABC transporter ATP-binding protein UgpC [Vibrio navarrensis]EKA5636340.1 sn-glycerol-3-phosphate ABC transporter ATP-binding protein UgpC [Vibrio navarrensis]ELN6932211.1 sn-glycerol-3-phosphate ABC transporter ATP-binding protein UgpC [Vibrio navarrensis]KGK11754.1 sugar ABC transporter ATPase [Vibrio navarrensis]MBE4583836.1 sn-glycerol-3-phosphate ABC transporter ATP
MAKVEFKNIKKSFGDVDVVKHFDFTVNDGEFVVFLGPSGCGKSTTLRMLAGLETITSGEIYVGDKLMNKVDAKDRDLAMVFQSYALYPHMTVYENIAFALKLKGMSKVDIDAEVRKAAKMLELEPLLDRKPKELSGGQRQRVAMGRAMVRTPKVFLFDEPLSNLDAKLRGVMREEIKQLHRELKTTTIYVTHDQIEAMTLADRIVILKDGYVAQVGTPTDVFQRPANKFVAQFIGSPSMNMLDAKLISKDNAFYIELGETHIPLPERFKALASKNLALHLGIRPTDIHLRAEHIDHERVLPFSVKIKDKELLGASILLKTEIAKQSLIVETQAAEVTTSELTLYLDLDAIHLFDALSENSLAS